MHFAIPQSNQMAPDLHTAIPLGIGTGGGPISLVRYWKECFPPKYEIFRLPLFFAREIIGSIRR